MSNVINTPNMSLPNPVPSADPGPDYATNLQSSLNIVDQHNHTTGQGVQIPTGGLNINAALPFNNQAATGVQAVVLNNQPSLATTNALYSISGELYYNDPAGVVQITSAGAVNATSSGITNGTASASFSSGVLVVNEATNTPANIEAGSILIGNNTANSNYVTLSATSSTPSYSLVLPTIPSSTSFVTLSTGGNLSGSISTTNGITRSNLAAVGQQVSSSSGVFTTTSTSFVNVTNLSVTLTTSGRPVMLMLVGDGSGHVSTIGTNNSSGVYYSANIQILRATNSICIVELGSQLNSAFNIPPGSVSFLDVVSAGTYVYQVQMAVSNAALTGNFVYCSLVAYEL